MPGFAVIAQYGSSLTYQDLSHESVHEAKRRVIDALGCGMGAWLSAPVKFARAAGELVEAKAGASLLGTRYDTSADLAAYANGVAIAWQGLEDRLGEARPSVNVAALLALAQTLDIPGEDIIRGLVVAYEVHGRLEEAARGHGEGPGPVWWATAAGIAGGGSMLEFDEATMAHALGLAHTAGRVGAASAVGCAAAARDAVFFTLLAHLGHESSHDGPAVEAVDWSDGREFVIAKTDLQRLPDQPGSGPLADDELADKFRALANPLLRPAQIDTALDLLWHLDEIDDVGEVFETLVV